MKIERVELKKIEVIIDKSFEHYRVEASAIGTENKLSSLDALMCKVFPAFDLKFKTMYTYQQVDEFIINHPYRNIEIDHYRYEDGDCVICICFNVTHEELMKYVLGKIYHM